MRRNGQGLPCPKSYTSFLVSRQRARLNLSRSVGQFGESMDMRRIFVFGRFQEEEMKEGNKVFCHWSKRCVGLEASRNTWPPERSLTYACDSAHMRTPC